MTDSSGNGPYGDPGSGDATSLWERDIEWAADQYVALVRELGPQVLNRPFGSVPVSKADEQEDFETRDPTYWTRRIQSARAALGGDPFKTAKEVLEHDVRMRGDR